MMILMAQSRELPSASTLWRIRGCCFRL